MTKLPDATANYLFDTCGYVMHRAHFDEPTVRELREQLERVWPADASGGIRRIGSLLHEFAEGRRLADELAKTFRVGNYLNQPFRLIESYGLRRSAGSFQGFHNGFGERLFSNPDVSRAMWRHHTYHDGKLYCMMVKVLVYLTDVVTLEDSPFCLVEGSHKANFPFPLPHKWDGDIPDLASVHAIYPKAGDVLVINEALMHGTYPKKSDGDRIVLAFSYSPSFVSDYVELPEEAPKDVLTTRFYS